MTVLFAAIAVDHDLQRHYRFLQTFFWSKAFAQSYDVAANTRMVTDFQALQRHLKQPDTALTTQVIPTVDPTDLFYATRRSHRAIWAAFICALTASDPPGLFANLLETVSTERRDVPPKRIVSLLPRGMEPDIVGADAPHLRVLGLARTSRIVASALGRKGFQRLLWELLESHGAGAVDHSLKQHLLPVSQQIIDAGEAWPELLRMRSVELRQFLEDRYDVTFTLKEED